MKGYDDDDVTVEIIHDIPSYPLRRNGWAACGAMCDDCRSGGIMATAMVNDSSDYEGNPDNHGDIGVDSGSNYWWYGDEIIITDDDDDNLINAGCNEN